MSGRVYAVASGKGGVGKTTTTINLGVALRVDGYSVAIVDADLGMANLGVSLGAVSDPTLHDVLAGDAELDDAIVEPTDGFGLLVGDTDLSRFAAAEPSRLNGVVDGLAERYDFVLVDSGAGLSYEDVLPIGLADSVLLVSMPDPAAIEDTRKTGELVTRIGERTAGVVVTRVDEDIDPEAVADQIGVPLLAAIPNDPTIPRSLDAGQPLEAYAPESPAAIAYRGLAAVIVGKQDPPAVLTAAEIAEATSDSAAAGDDPGDDADADDGSDTADAIEEAADAAESPEDDDEDAAGGDGESGGEDDPDGDVDPGGSDEGVDPGDAGEGGKPGLLERVLRRFG